MAFIDAFIPNFYDKVKKLDSRLECKELVG